MPSMFTEEERLARIRASQARYRERNREFLREVVARSKRRPEYLEQRRHKYYAHRAALIEFGLLEPRGIGRPKLYKTDEERLAARKLRYASENKAKREVEAAYRALVNSRTISEGTTSASSSDASPTGSTATQRSV